MKLLETITHRDIPIEVWGTDDDGAEEYVVTLDKKTVCFDQDEAESAVNDFLDAGVSLDDENEEHRLRKWELI